MYYKIIMLLAVAVSLSVASQLFSVYMELNAQQALMYENLMQNTLTSSAE